MPDLVLAPGDCRLLVQDAAAAGAWLAELTASGLALPCDPAPPVEVAGWPSLNNTAPASRDFARALALAGVLDADGRVLAVIDGQPVALVWISGPGTLDLIAGDFAPIGYSSAASLVAASLFLALPPPPYSSS